MDDVSGSLFRCVDREGRIGGDGPRRAIWDAVKAGLVERAVEFDALVPPANRDPVSPERSRRAMLLQAFR